MGRAEKPEKGERGGEELERRFSLQIPDPEHYPAPTPPLLSQELVIEEAMNPRPGDTERPLCEGMMMGRLESLGGRGEEAGQGRGMGSSMWKARTQGGLGLRRVRAGPSPERGLSQSMG